MMETSSKRLCIGALYLANSAAIQSNCRFRIAEAREKIFELSENTWAINMNDVYHATNDVTEIQIQSRDTIKIRPGCNIRTMDQVILADKSDTIEIWIKAMDCPGRSPTSFVMATSKPSTRQCKGCRQNTMVRLTPPSCLTNWTTCKSQTHTGLLCPRQP